MSRDLTMSSSEDAVSTGKAAGSSSEILYSPVQPAVTEDGEHVRYREYLPAPALQRYIYRYWELQTTQPLQAPFSYRVVADGCIDIAFNMRMPQESIVMGFYNTFNEFSLDVEFHYVGVRFLPGMFPLVFDINAAELSNRLQPLNGVLPETARFLHEYLDPDFAIKKVMQVLDQHFVRQFGQIGHDADHRFFNALQYIFARQGVLNLGNDIDTGLSSRQMRRLFDFYVGDSPKSFAKVVRFQNILNAKPSLESLRENKFFFDAGYYDQAHFIKEFRNFYGVTPSKAFAKKSESC